MPGVLLVENERPRQRLLAWVLQQEGISVTVVDPARCAEAATPRAVVVLNASIPSLERRSLIERLHTREARVVELVDDDEAAATAADAYIAEPYRAADIVSAIERLGGD